MLNKWWHWALCIVIIFFGGFSTIMVVNELTREGFQRGSIDARNRFSMPSFEYITNGIFFSYDFDEGVYLYEQGLRPVPSFDGAVFDYYVELNGNVIFDARIGERYVVATVPFSFYCIDGSHLITAELNIRILFWNMRTDLRVTVTGSQEQTLLHRFLLDNTFRLFVNEIRR